jgi:hypothetical protein
MARLTKAGGGLSAEPGIVGSDQWWALVGTDRLPLLLSATQAEHGQAV